ncbi:MAG: Gfo/Idh/MocA family oxidoreductase [Abitibacteriaceae bacterium]|nr:Gfo/Idh/MocA family oxidoreductase [Abditibacteriaceae bacterium]MBV9868637.1 Gfo/Idh/MocA family oxidoreductase [Abditibacteriaceae bacterium]
MQPLRFGIVGCGGIAGLHADCLRNLEKDGLAQLVAGAETDAGRREKFGQKWNLAMHDSLESLLARDDIDVVTVTTPSGMHGQNCVDIARSGRHVLCEKPMDVKVEKVDEAIAAARENKVVLGGIFQQRFAPGPMKVKRAVEGGYFGDIVFVHCETPWYRAQSYYDSGDWRGTWELDGGVLSNQSPHMIDRLIWLGGDIEEVISATCESRDRNIEAETLAVATIRLNNGALGTITGTTLAYDGLDQRVLICGTEGSASFTGDNLTYFKTKEPFVEEGTGDNARNDTGSNTASDPLALSSNSHEANIRDFIMAVRENREPLVTAEDQRKVVRSLNLIYEKAGVGRYAK